MPDRLAKASGTYNGRWDLAQNNELHYWETWLGKDVQLKIIGEKLWVSHYNILKDLISPTNDTRVLEIGTGPMPLIHHLPDCSKYAIDSMMRFFVSKFAMPSDINYLGGVGEAMPFDENCFDLIVASNVLDHVQNPLSFCREMHRVLRTNGLLCLTVDCYSTIFSLYRSVWEKLGRGDKYHPFSFNPRAIKRLISDSDLELTYMENQREYRKEIFREFLEGSKTAEISRRNDKEKRIPESNRHLRDRQQIRLRITRPTKKLLGFDNRDTGHFFVISRKTAREESTR